MKNSFYEEEDYPKLKAQADELRQLLAIPDNAPKSIANELAKSPTAHLHREDDSNFVLYVEWRGMSASFWGMTPDRARTRADEWLKKVGYYTDEDEN